MVERLRDVYALQDGGGKAVFLRDVYELLERVTDRFRDAGNVVSIIALKGS
jgi:uncharacterized protein Yka (UPF0111/DUF47 family)